MRSLPAPTDSASVPSCSRPASSRKSATIPNSHTLRSTCSRASRSGTIERIARSRSGSSKSRTSQSFAYRRESAIWPLPGAAGANDRGDRLQHDREVEEDGPALEVEEVESHELVEV